MKRIMNVVLWVLSIFMAVAALVYIPSAASIIMLLFAVIATPVKPLQNFFKSKGLSGAIKGVLLTVLFFVAIALAPTSEDQAGKNDEKKSISVSADRNAAANLTETTPVSSKKPEKPEEKISPDERLKNNVLSYFQDNGVEDPKIKILKNRVDIKVYSDYSIESRPEEWDSIVEKNVTLCKALKDETEETSGKSISIVQYGNNDTILLTVIDGECEYDFYRTETKEDKKYTLPCGMELQYWDSVENDITDNLRRSATSDSFIPADYAYEYYKNVFSSNDEIHAIWNATLRTTTCIKVVSGLLFVDTFEYVDGEEHNANIMFSGQQLDSRVLDAATGEPWSEEEQSAENEDDITSYDNTSKAGSYDATESGNDTGRTIYITNTCKKYHYDNNCNGGTYFPSTLNEALKLGLTPCSRCVN